MNVKNIDEATQEAIERQIILEKMKGNKTLKMYGLAMVGFQKIKMARLHLLQPRICHTDQ